MLFGTCYTSPNQSRRHQQGYGCPTAYYIRFLGQMKAVFPSLLGVASLRLRRHAKGTCDFLIPHLHQWGTSGRYPMPFVKEGRTRPYIQCACSSTRLSQQYKKLESKRVRPYIQCACSSILPMETQDRRQSDSAEAYMAFPKMLHYCLACLQ